MFADESIYDTETSIYDWTDAAELFRICMEILIVRRRIFWILTRNNVSHFCDKSIIFRVNRIYIAYISAFMSLIYDSVLWNKDFPAYVRFILYTIVSTYFAKLIDFQERIMTYSTGLWFLRWKLFTWIILRS